MTLCSTKMFWQKQENMLKLRINWRWTSWIKASNKIWLNVLQIRWILPSQTELRRKNLAIKGLQNQYVENDDWGFGRVSQFAVAMQADKSRSYIYIVCATISLPFFSVVPLSTLLILEKPISYQPNLHIIGLWEETGVPGANPASMGRTCYSL